MGLVYGSVCSGIEAASVAWHPLGWRASFLSEIEAFPRAVLAHRWPEVQCHGDFTTIEAGQYEPIDLLVGGTPCQGLSVAGRRGGLRDDRSVLALEYSRLADRLRPKWLAWENVPGAFSTRDDEDDEAGAGEDFAAFLSTLVRWSVQVPVGGFKNAGILAPGPVDGAYGVAWRVLDAQFAGVPQRRRRIFVVGRLGDWRAPAAVLLEPHSLSDASPPRRASPEDVAGTLGTTSHDFSRSNIGECIVPFDTTQITSAANYSNPQPGDPCHPLAAGAHPPAIAFALRGRDGGAMPEVEGAGEVAGALRAASGGSSRDYVATAAGVRRLTPRECERLQGFPDNYTDIQMRGKPAADGPRYKALGNSMAVPVMAWIGQRIAAVDAIPLQQRAAA